MPHYGFFEKQMYSYTRIQNSGSKHWHGVMTTKYKIISRIYGRFLYSNENYKGSEIFSGAKCFNFK